MVTKLDNQSGSVRIERTSAPVTTLQRDADSLEFFDERFIVVGYCILDSGMLPESFALNALNILQLLVALCKANSLGQQLAKLFRQVNTEDSSED